MLENCCATCEVRTKYPSGVHRRIVNAREVNRHYLMNVTGKVAESDHRCDRCLVEGDEDENPSQ